MRRHLFFLALSTAILLLCALACPPRSSTASDGRGIFIQRCGSCHGKGKEAPAVNPADYAAVQWKNFFKRRKHRRKKDITGLMNPEEAQAILRYLESRAADSDQPEVAAIP